MKLLVATDFPPDSPGGGPAVVRQMLKGFPGEIHWWSCRSGGAPPANAGFPVATLWSCPPGKLQPAARLTRLKAWAMEQLWAPWATLRLLQTIRRTQPDTIWAIPHDWSILPLFWALKAARRGSKPRLHVTIQDYPDIHGHGRLWGEERVQRMARMQEALFATADSRDATSLPMLADLETRTGCKGDQMLHQGLEDEDFQWLEQKYETLKRQASIACNFNHPIKIAYAGTILLEKEFEMAVRMIERMLPKNSTPADTKGIQPSQRIELHFWGAHSYANRPWFQAEWMFEHGNLPERDLIYALRECDFGLIPMALDDNDLRYNRFSFPTKFITYLAVGLPPIVLGHPESSVVKMAEKYGVGLRVMGSGRISSYQGSGVGLLTDLVATSKMLETVLRCARDEFDAERMRRLLWVCLGMSDRGRF